jgi:fused signal recognition particle receptor
MTNTDSDNSREWAAQAYALLKKRQEEQKQELQRQEEQKQESIDIANKENIPGQPKTISETELGEFDDNFTWSAMVLAAQGKK